jgi:hypothetical protein
MMNRVFLHIYLWIGLIENCPRPIQIEVCSMFYMDKFA